MAQGARRQGTEEELNFDNLIEQDPKGLERAVEGRRSVRAGPGEAQTFPRYGRGRVEEPRQPRLCLEGVESGSLRRVRAGSRWIS